MLKRISLLFPGQGSQFVGMAKDLFAEFAEVQLLLNNADKILKIPLSNIMFNGPMEQLKQTENTQPAVFLHSLAIVKILQNETTLFKDNRVDHMLGHSLGEYSALATAGSIDIESTLPLIRQRGMLMKQARHGTMAALLSKKDFLVADSNSSNGGSAFKRLEEYARELERIDPTNDLVNISNVNSPNQIVISGTESAIDKMISFAKQNKLVNKTVKLEVSAAFHSQLMKDSSDQYNNDYLNHIDFKQPSNQVISNVTGKPYTNSNNIKEYLSQQMVSKVDWVSSIRYCIDDWKQKEQQGYFIEIGPQKVLTQLLKQIDPTAEYINLSTIDEVKDFINKYKENKL
ncbi:hypothetical protein PPL_02900 [Heterostelium album PN500]|uniref:[acyl-carrier-protein] S-malonyltransferase n=1 Tax=Heterostelium pallidum (strain ATCC 26659 / Pp 5 / PN500) TaxID=670386 RepID=D3B3D4_HETP5|nr:hypothetical protein PPL_02900 [Heterostelium album PN500]EFA83832.1 hypothetical protein PPL_02900 [Heterostelium album PN500]|eukprot:XP_020435949.1 hypothetical protein PPL_02900 [Heterostelium album PN500]